MPDIVLTAEPRTAVGSRPAGRLRREGKVPAVVYGLRTDTLNVTVPARELAHILAGEAGANTLITLKVDGDDVLTLARQIQRHPTRGDLVHVDFVRIRRDVAVQAEIPVHLVGEEPEGVRDGGLLEQLLFTLSIEAKPEDIPPAIEVDASGLAIGDQLRVEELPLPAGVSALHEPDELVVQLVVSRVAQELEAIEAGEAAAAEEAAAVEGEAPPEGEEAAVEGEVPAAEGGEEGGEGAGASGES